MLWSVIEHDHELYSFSRKRAAASLSAVELNLLGIPEPEQVDHPIVIGSLRGDDVIPFMVGPVSIQNIGQTVKKAERIAQRECRERHSIGWG